MSGGRRSWLVSSSAVVVAVCALCVVSVATAQTYGTLKFASFNIQVFGTTKASNPDVMGYIVLILQRYDLIAIQEIRDATNTAFPYLMQLLNQNVTGIRTYSSVVGPREGRTSSKEQYAFIYDPAKLTPGRQYVYPDLLNHFERPPMAVEFKISGADSSVPTFAYIDIHTSPDSAVSEIGYLADVAVAVRANMSIPNTITVGDFNAGCSYVSNSDWPNIPFYTDPQYKWYINNSADTMVKTDCPYDRIVSTGPWTSSALVGASAGAFDYMAYWHMTQDFAALISDHLNIQIDVRFLKTGGSGGGSTGGNGNGSTGLDDGESNAKGLSAGATGGIVVGVVVGVSALVGLGVCWFRRSKYTETN